VDAQSGLGKAISGLSDLAKAGEQGFSSFEKFSSGDILGGIESGIGAVTSLIGGIGKLFGGNSQAEKDADELGEVLGKKVSDSIAKTVEDDAKKFHLAIDDAALLHLQDQMNETGESAHEMGDKILELEKGVADGTLPATQGAQELGQAWDDVRKEAEAAGTV